MLICLSFHFVNSFEVQTLNGSTMDWNKSLFCLDDPAKYQDLVGDDYYLYCEPSFGEEYNAKNDDLVSNLNKFAISKNNTVNISNKNGSGVKKNQTFHLENENNSVNNTLDKKNNIPNNDWQLFAGLIGVILLLIVAILIIAHRFAIKRDEKKQLINLTPYINNLRKKGYTENQLEEILIKKGYKSIFINNLLNKK